MNAPSGRAVATTSASMRPIWMPAVECHVDVTYVASARSTSRKRSKLLGVEKRVDEVDSDGDGDYAAEDEIEHARPHAFAAQRA